MSQASARIPPQSANQASVQRLEEKLYLHRDLFLCVAQGHCVFLDLARDRYSALVLEASRSGNETDHEHRLLDTLYARRTMLCDSGVLTTDAAQGRTIALPTFTGATRHILGLNDRRAYGLPGQEARGLQISVREALAFFEACATASRELKHKHIAQIVARVRARKANEQRNSVGADLAAVARLTRVFARLRPWYPRAYLCLYDSLALTHFLARLGVFPLWVFAVQIQPFGAHCWVQYQDHLLNEGSEYADQFTPIMGV